jgi:alpha-glucosidase
MNRVIFALVLLATTSAWGNLLSTRKNEKRQNDMLENVDWYENTILYQIYPRSFQDSNGDGIGDINGIISRLDYLQETGIQTLWLSPVLKSPQKDFGYDISDFELVDPIFGTNDDLIRLFAEAKTRNIKVILDFVPNHTSNEHDWFVKSERSDPVYKDFYVWHPGKMVAGRRLPPNNWVNNLSETVFFF